MRIDEIAQRVVWHASYVSGITEFRFLTHLGTWSAAAERALQKDFYPDVLKLPELRPIYVYQVDMSACRRGVQVRDDPDFGDPLDHVVENMRFLPKEVREKFDQGEHYHILQRQLPKIFDDAGIDYLWYYNKVESPRSRSYVVLNPDCFKIVGVEKLTATDLMLADLKMVERLFQRKVWPDWWKPKIQQHLRQKQAAQQGDISFFQK